MKISVFGLGYVGTVCAACLARLGHTVTGVDKASTKVDLIRSGRSPIVEQDIDALVRESVKAGRLCATLDAASAVATTDLSLICVGTPSEANGALCLNAIKSVTVEIGHALRVKSARHIVVMRSTVLPGTSRQIILPLLVESSGKTPGDGFGLAFNPEFLRESTAVADFENPSKTVVGALDEATAAEVMSLYASLPGPHITAALETAELVKYVDNAWHALKVTFANEIGLIGNALHLDSHEVMNIFCEDKRLNISAAYLRPGFAFGGSCLPKDLRALTYLARRLDLALPVLDNVRESNRMLIERGVAWILTQERRRIAFLGISFKAGTDDVRESPFVEVIERLIGKGCEVRIFDPNVQLSQLIGANKDYLVRAVPHITELMVADVVDVVRWAQTIVVTTKDPVYSSAIAAARPDQVVLAFVHLDGPINEAVRVEGFLW